VVGAVRDGGFGGIRHGLCCQRAEGRVLKHRIDDEGRPLADGDGDPLRIFKRFSLALGHAVSGRDRVSRPTTAMPAVAELHERIKMNRSTSAEPSSTLACQWVGVRAVAVRVREGARVTRSRRPIW
jgi:hypothetical protein